MSPSRETKTWWNVGLETGIGWPSTRQVVPFAGRVFILHPYDEHDSASVSVAYNEPIYSPTVPDALGEPRCADFGEARSLMQRFLSALAWVADKGLTTHNEQSAGHLYAVPRMRQGGVIHPGQTFDYLPDPESRDARLALALYREGLSVNSVPYQFLAFAKVLNIKLTKEGQRKWVNDHVDQVTDYEARRRIAELRASGANIGEYLYREGRVAVAHAIGKWRTVDPDDPVRVDELRADVPLMHALARMFIEMELGVNTPAKEAAEREREFWKRRGMKPPR